MNYRGQASRLSIKLPSAPVDVVGVVYQAKYFSIVQIGQATLEVLQHTNDAAVSVVRCKGFCTNISESHPHSSSILKCAISHHVCQLVLDSKHLQINNVSIRTQKDEISPRS